MGEAFRSVGFSGRAATNKFLHRQERSSFQTHHGHLPLDSAGVLSCNALHLILRNLRYTLRFSVTLRIAIYFGTFDVISVYLFNEAVRKRYAHLVKMILSSTIRDGSVEVILKNEEEKGRVQKLRKVFSIHKTLYACVEQLNDIFGWKIYLVLQNVVVSLLSTFNSVVLFLKDQHLVPWKEEIIYSTVFSAVFAVSVFLNYSTLSEGSSFPLTI